MNKVVSESGAVNEVEDEGEMKPFTDWMKKMADRGLIKMNVARMRIGAVRALVSVMDGEEEKTPEAVLAQVDDLTKRWAVKCSGTPDTAAAYASRSRGALTDYLAYLKDPTGFRFKVREVAPGERKKTPKPSKVEAKAEPSVPEPVPVAPALAGAAPGRTMRDCPLGGGRHFVFSLPEDFSMLDAARVAMHLVTITHDFDPFQQTPAQAISSIITVPRSS